MRSTSRVMLAGAEAAVAPASSCWPAGASGAALESTWIWLRLLTLKTFFSALLSIMNAPSASGSMPAVHEEPEGQQASILQAAPSTKNIVRRVYEHIYMVALTKYQLAHLNLARYQFDSHRSTNLHSAHTWQSLL